MKNRVLSILLVMVMIFTMMPTSAITSFSLFIIGYSGDFKYEVIDEEAKTVSITGYKGSDENIEFPSEIEGYKVTEIDLYSPSSAYTEIVSVIVPNGVTRICLKSFENCINLTTITLPYSLNTIESLAFDNCISLKTVVFGGTEKEWNSIYGNDCFNEYYVTILFDVEREIFEYEVLEDETAQIISYDGVKEIIEIPSEIDGYTVTSIGDGAFYGNYANKVILPETITSIGNRSFSNMSNLTEIVISNGVTTIGEEAFSQCNSLTKIVIPNSVTSIGYKAFYQCESLSNIIIPDTAISIDENAFFETAYYYNESNWEDGVLYIDNHLITYNNDIPSIYEVKPGTITIADYAFDRCDILCEITLPDSLITIGIGAFAWCDSLYNVEFGENIKTIKYGAFAYCDYLRNVNLPNGVTTIESYAFHFLSNFTIPGSVTTLGKNAVRATYNITLLDGITTIPDYAFSECEGLTSLVIPESVTSIGVSAFVDLNTIVYYGSEEQWNAIDIAENNEALNNANISFNGQENYDFEYEVLEDGTAKITGYTGYPVNLEIPSEIDGYTVTTIGDNAFEECPATSVVLPDTVTVIGLLSFYNMTALKEVVIPDSVETIGIGAFAYCCTLTEITIPDSVETIGNLAFLYCLALCDIKVDVSNENYCAIDGVLFNKDATILIQYPAGRIQFEYTIPESVETICEGAFSDYRHLKELTIHENLKVIGDSNFYYCSWLENVYYIGTKCQWDAIAIGESNDDLLGVTINYALGEHAYGEFEFPTEAGFGVTGEMKHTCECCGNEEIHEYQLGDADGDDTYTENDYAMIIQASACGIALTEEQIIMADVDGDGAVDTFDAMALDMYMN